MTISDLIRSYCNTSELLCKALAASRNGKHLTAEANLRAAAVAMERDVKAAQECAESERLSSSN